jgi:amidase
MGIFEEYINCDGLGLAELVKRKEVEPLELLEAAIQRIEAFNPQLNAVVTKMYDQARQAAEGDLPHGPFQGVPFLLKDLGAEYRGVPLTMGSRFFRKYVPGYDGELVRRYKSAGVVILGKTNTPELGLLPTTESELHGSAYNPWDHTRTTGGSSGGSAAAVAAGFVPLAHGNDGGGSIRIPAACCGLFGLKPTRGRTPTGPVRGEEWQGMAIDHVLTRSVRDSAAMLDATCGPEAGAATVAPPPARPFLEEVGADPGVLRIAFTPGPFLPGKIHPYCLAGLEATAKLCQDLGHRVEEAAPPINGEAFAKAFFTMTCGETRATIEEGARLVGRKPAPGDFEPATWAVAMLGRQICAADYTKALHYLRRSARDIGRFFQDYDVLLTPTLGMPPVKLGQLLPQGAQGAALNLLASLNAGRMLRTFLNIDELVGTVFEFIPNLPVFNATGQPAMSVPLHRTEDGLPIGMHFVSRFGDEATLLRLASQLEQARPWFERMPPLLA